MSLEQIQIRELKEKLAKANEKIEKLLTELNSALVKHNEQTRTLLNLEKKNIAATNIIKKLINPPDEAALIMWKEIAKEWLACPKCQDACCGDDPR